MLLLFDDIHLMLIGCAQCATQHSVCHVLEVRHGGDGSVGATVGNLFISFRSWLLIGETLVDRR